MDFQAILEGVRPFKGMNLMNVSAFDTSKGMNLMNVSAFGTSKGMNLMNVSGSYTDGFLGLQRKMESLLWLDEI